MNNAHQRKAGEKTSLIRSPMQAGQGCSRKHDWILRFLLLTALLFVYQPAWNGQPVWDDSNHMTGASFQSIHGLKRIWTDIGATQQYYPLMHSVFWVEYHLWGYSVFGYHMVTIALHFFSALLLVGIMRRLSLPGGWIAAAIFALHPVNVESVAWISELKNTLSGMFFLSAALLFLEFDRKRTRRLYAFSLILFLLGLVSKSVIALLPVALLLVAWWKEGRVDWKQNVVPLLPFFIIGIAAGLFTSWVERKVIGAEGGEFNYSLIERFLIAGRAIFFYLGKLCFPHDLIFIYPRWNINRGMAWQYAFPAMVAVLIGIFWRLRKRQRAPLTALLYFIGMLFPVLGFFNVYPSRYSFVADHFQYLACIGPIVMAGVCMSKALETSIKWGRMATSATVTVMFATLCILSREQTGMYADAETLFRTAIKKNPECWMAYNNLGVLMARNGKVDESIVQFRNSLKFYPNGVNAMRNLATAFAQKGHPDDAIPLFRRALHLADSLGMEREAGQISGLLKKATRLKAKSLDTLIPGIDAKK